MKKIKVGIIGAGRIGMLHANNILKSEQLELKAISDIHTNHLSKTKYEEIVPLITNRPDEVLEHPEIDAVFICSLTDTHAPYIQKAAEQGKHIFCEKPISFDIEKTRDALKFVQESGVKFQVGFNRRFDKHFHKVFKVVREGKIGTPHMIKISSRDPEIPSPEYIKYSGGMFMDMTIHDFDMVRYLSGKEVVEVSVKAANLVDPVFVKYDDVDTAVITLTLEGGAIAVIDNSRQAVYGYDQRIEVFGDQGSVSADNESKTNVQISTRSTVELDRPKHFFLDRYKDAFIEEVKEFAKAIIRDRPLTCTGEDGYKAEQLAAAARLSWKENRSVLLSEFEHANMSI